MRITCDRKERNLDRGVRSLTNCTSVTGETSRSLIMALRGYLM